MKEIRRECNRNMKKNWYIFEKLEEKFERSWRKFKKYLTETGEEAKENFKSMRDLKEEGLSEISEIWGRCLKEIWIKEKKILKT